MNTDFQVRHGIGVKYVDVRKQNSLRTYERKAWGISLSGAGTDAKANRNRWNCYRPAPFSKMATARTGAAAVLTHLIGNMLTLNPKGGNSSRFVKFSM